MRRRSAPVRRTAAVPRSLLRGDEPFEILSAAQPCAVPTPVEPTAVEPAPAQTLPGNPPTDERSGSDEPALHKTISEVTSVASRSGASTRPARTAFLEAPERVLFVGKSMSRSRCSGGLVDALAANGLAVRWFNFARNRRWLGQRGAEWRARRTFWSFRPHLLFVLSRDLPVSLLDEFRAHAPVVVWIEDLQDRLEEPHIDYLRRADLVSMSDPSRFEELRALGVQRLIYQMSGFSPRYHFPVARRRPRHDAVFVGGPGRRGQRASFLAQLADVVDIDVFGAGWDDHRDLHPRLRTHGPIDNGGYRKVCAQSRIVLGMNESNSTPGYFSNRTWLTLACRGFHLTHHVPGLERVFERGEHLDWFSDVGEAARLIEHYLAAPDEELERIATAGHRLALAQHQYRHRVAAILDRFTDGRDDLDAGLELRSHGEEPGRLAL